MSVSPGRPLQTEAFKRQVRRHCEKKVAEGLSPRAPSPQGARFQPHEQRRSSDGQLPPMFLSKDPFRGPPPVAIPKHVQQQQASSAEVRVSSAEFRVEMDVSGYGPDELAVRIVGDHVVIKGKHAEGGPGENANLTRQFSRQYALPEDAAVEEVSVFLSRTGKLSVRVPRRTADREEKHPAEKLPAERKSKVTFKE